MCWKRRVVVLARAITSRRRRRTAATWRFSSDLHCADCDIHYREPTPSLFSFNSPLGACEIPAAASVASSASTSACIIPDESKTLKGGAIRPWQTESYRECQDDLIKYARKRNIPIDVPWRELTEQQRQWVLEGEGSWEDKVWYGVRRFFAWLETKSYKMHIRVLLSKYRAYTPCTVCDGARLKTDALVWRLGTKADAKAVLPDHLRFKPNGVQWNDEQLAELPGIGIHELMLLPIDRCKQFFDRLALPAPLDEASDLVLREIRGRFGYLLDVGLGYLTLDRQSRTLSGGEVQRINLTTALGTSLVNTLFVLDEPSIGLHPRDMGRVIDVMRRLKAAGNSLVVVEHDPQVMQAADQADRCRSWVRARRAARSCSIGEPVRVGEGRTFAHGGLSARPQAGQRGDACCHSSFAECRADGERRATAQPQGHRRLHSVATPGVRHRRVGLGQVDADSRRAVPGAAASTSASRPRRRASTTASRARRTSVRS